MNKILLFDDDDVIRMLYESELSEEGYDVIFSGDASRCLEMIRKHRPNVVVIDEKMGKHDGVDVPREIRDRFPAIPLVLCTVYPLHVSQKGDMVVNFCVAKSSDFKDLKLKIKAAMEIWGEQHDSQYGAIEKGGRSSYGTDLPNPTPPK